MSTGQRAAEALFGWEGNPIVDLARLAYRERKCADTTGTVLVPWAGHFQC